MSISIFKFGSRQCNSIRLPLDRQSDADWHPQINDKFPDFTVRSTKGQLNFSDWAGGSWVLLVAHPAAFTPVCTSEIRALAQRHAEFEERQVKIIALTGDSLERLQDWSTEIERDIGVEIPFPHISDENQVIVRGCGFVSKEPLARGKYCARRSMLIDPAGIVRMIMDYPVAVGRSVDETLRSIDALILTERLDAFAPSDWQLGEPLMPNHLMTQRQRERRSSMKDIVESSCFRTDQMRAPAKSRTPNPRGERLPVISNTELRRLVGEHNLRMKANAEKETVISSEVFARFRV